MTLKFLIQQSFALLFWRLKVKTGISLNKAKGVPNSESDFQKNGQSLIARTLQTLFF